MNFKKVSWVAAIILLIGCVIVIAYVPVVKLLSRTVTTDRPLFSNERYINEGFEHWEIPHLDKDKQCWEFIVDGGRNVVVLFEPTSSDNFDREYSIQPPRAGERTLRVWLNNDLSHEFVVDDDKVYLIRGAVLVSVAAPDELANSLLRTRSETNRLDFTVGAFLASHDKWMRVAHLVNAEQSERETEAIRNSSGDTEGGRE